MGVQELESGVSCLSEGDFARFEAWFEEFVAERWDRQIEADALAGRLDRAGDRADADFEAGRAAVKHFASTGLLAFNVE